jgi:arginase family enzyme
MTDYLQMVEDLSTAAFAADPRPGWSGLPTLFGSPVAPLHQARTGGFVVAGIPFDGTASSRPGAAEGPAAIRRASLVFSSYLDSLGEHEMLDMRTGRAFRYRKADLVDVGDLHTYPTQTERTFCAVAAEVRAIAQAGATPILLGGDHSIGAASFAGVLLAGRDRQPGSRLGLVQIDHHFDFGDQSAIHGGLYHGSNARRISEMRGMTLERMAFIGQGNVTRLAQHRDLLERGAQIVPARDIRARGVEPALAPVLEAIGRHCSAIHLSIDIDCLDASFAPGTGHVTIGGMSTGELFDAVALIAGLPLVAIEIVEVAPRYDPTGRTAQIAAQLLFELLFREGACGGRP